MSSKTSRGCKFVCTECQHIWFTGSKEPSRFAKKWPGVCEKCERKQKTERERAAKEKKEEEEKKERERAAEEKKKEEEKEEKKKKENALISKRNEVQEAKVNLHQRKFEAEKELLKMKLEFYKKAPEDKEVQKKVFEIIEELRPFTEPNLEPEKFSTTQPMTEENYHEQMSEAEMRLEKIKLLQKGFEANQEISIWKLDTYTGMKVDVALLDKISNLKISDTVPQDSESPPTLRL